MDHLSQYRQCLVPLEFLQVYIFQYISEAFEHSLICSSTPVNWPIVLNLVHCLSAAALNTFNSNSRKILNYTVICTKCCLCVSSR